MAHSTESRTVLSGYFTCTLGEAIGSSVHHELETVNDLIDYQAKQHLRDVAVGFPVPRKDQRGWGSEAFTFGELRRGSVAIAEELSSAVLGGGERSGLGCVALLCPSSVDFLFTWLGLMRAGYAVLLIAPQLQPAAIAHLCRSCEVKVLLFDKSLKKLASEAASSTDSNLISTELPWQSRSTPIVSLIRKAGASETASPRGGASASDTAFIFHTSGTSTGLPKPIPQSHHAAFRVLPSFNSRESATFSTTPLYHGGIADCFRAWTSGAPIWLFPAALVPITTKNIQLSLSAAADFIPDTTAASVRYFSSVPYVLEMLAKDSSGLSLLQSMGIVGVGGAALSPAIGNYLVGHGVNLVSRFGSAECGFLLSSHRVYESDKEWQYLRLSPQTQYLTFEKHNDDPGLYELVVRRGWPHLAKSNREDGSFATSDLFEPHKSIRGAWKYHSRSDSQITLTTGKKFDPAPIEDSIASSSPVIREVVVFGSDRQNPGALIFPSRDSETMSKTALEDSIWKVVRDVNSKGQAHTRILRDRLVIMSMDEPALERSSKGTLLRAVVEKKFAKQIESVYSEDQEPSSCHVETAIEDGDVKGMILRIVSEVCGKAHGLSDDDDFYAHGIDSATGIRIRSLLQRDIVQSGDELPWNVVYDCGNINALTEYMIRFKGGISATPDQVGEEEEMLGLVKKFSNFETKSPTTDSEKLPMSGKQVVLLTGATGALGAHLLDLLRKQTSVSQIFCLVRAVDHHTARSRVSGSLLKRKKESLEISDPKVWCSPCKLSDSNLGLSDMEMGYLRENVTHAIHAAWAVNFSIPLKSFVEEHITGIHNLLNFSYSCTNSITFTFCSSTASVLGLNPPSLIPEQLSPSPSAAGPTGYSKSKWSAEAICGAAASSLPGNVNILRIGQLTGDTQNGVWNVSEAWPLLLSTVDALDCLPRLDEPLSWLPLDIAATAVLDITFPDIDMRKGKTAQVYHVVNNSTETTWRDLLRWSQDVRTTPFEVVEPEVWLQRLEGYPKRHPAKNLLGLWKGAFGGGDGKGKEEGVRHAPVFGVVEAEKRSEAMRSVVPVDGDLVGKIWGWLDEEVRSAKEQVYVSNNRFASA